MKEVVIVSAVRTAIGSFGGALKDITPMQLGAIVIEEAIAKAKIKKTSIDEVIFGCVLQAGHGQGVARQAALKAGIPNEVPATTINMICGSGLKTVSLATQSIIAGDNDIVVVGGTENMSMSPYVLKSNRWGQKMGNSELCDTMINDGLWDAFNNYHMGVTAENIAEQWNLTREEQDEFAFNSQMKASRASESGRFKDEIVPVNIPMRRGEDIVFDTDEYIKSGSTIDKLANLRPAFEKNGTVTAGNASGINDGAVALVIMSREKADELGVKPLVTVVSHASAGVDPSIMGTGPIPATKKALKKAKLEIKNLDLIEANEAFASQALAVINDLELDQTIVNVNGGAIALGHPIGASGARILVTLIHEMLKRESTYGLATLCIGGGMGEAVIVKR